MKEKPVDERGIPTLRDDTDTSAPYCPEKPCDLCTGFSQVDKPDKKGKMTSWEWCQEMKTCGATVDWEKVFHQYY